MADVLKERTDALDRNRKAHSLHDALIDTLKSLAWSEEQFRRSLDALEAVGEAPRMFTDAAKKARRRAWSPTKDIERLSGCQSEWIGFKPQCCDGRSVAVPIGCNHRLCPLCNNHRAERYRSRVQALFGTLSNPQLLTLTVPSPRMMTREVIDTLRRRLKAFLKQESPLLKGGVYSIEITYNKHSKTWHPHVHCLVDIADERIKLPYAEFVRRKQKLEFAWLVLTQGKRRAGERAWRNTDYDEWAQCVSERRDGYVGSAAGRNRRVVDLRPVTRDRKAAYEVLKYMSKAASFLGDPAALKQLLIAIRGVRQIQTFGSCYGFTIDDPAATSHLECECGANVFESIGRLGLGMVKLSPEGTWYVRDDAPVHGRHRCRGHST
jgi:hypothetical protein